MSDQTKVTFQLNNTKISETAYLSMMLADYLHEIKGLTATRVCCGIGVCRACTVAVKRAGEKSYEATRACITPVSSLDGASIKTTESLADGTKLHPLQDSFLKNFAFQCGYSTSGFLMGAYVILDKLQKNPISASGIDEAILAGLGDHICRCTGYQQYYAAVKEVILTTPGLVRD